MLAVIISWIVLFITFAAFGAITTSILRKSSENFKDYSVVDKIWIGMCTIGTLLLYLSIFTSLSIWILACFITFALVYILLNKNSIYINCRMIVQKFLQTTLLTKLLLLMIFVCIIVFSLGTSYSYDQGLYHLQVMQWTENFKAIVGLGNLHGRLAFNSSSLLLSTLFNYHPNEYIVFFTINSFSLLTLSLWLVYKAISIDNLLHKGVLFFVLLITIFIHGKGISSSSTDLLPNFMTIYLLISWALDPDYYKKKGLLLVIIPVFCITLKLSSLFIALIPLYYFFLLLKEKERKKVIIFILVGITMIAPWLVRYIIFTGYLIYPFSSIDIFSFDWKIPTVIVNEEQVAAYAWARIPFQDPSEVINLSFFEWFPIWLKNISYSIYKILLYSLSVISPIVMLFSKKDNRCIIWVIAFVGTIFGFVTAPDFRFTFGFITTAGVIPFLLINSNLSIFPKRYFTMILYYGSIGALIFIAHMAVRHVEFLQKTYSSKSYISLIYTPQSIHLFKEGDKNLFEEYKLGNTIIFVPQGSDQCFDKDIPCTPHIYTNLELRGDKLQDGFRIKK